MRSMRGRGSERHPFSSWEPSASNTDDTFSNKSGYSSPAAIRKQSVRNQRPLPLRLPRDSVLVVHLPRRTPGPLHVHLCKPSPRLHPRASLPPRELNGGGGLPGPFLSSRDRVEVEGADYSRLEAVEEVGNSDLGRDPVVLQCHELQFILSLIGIIVVVVVGVVRCVLLTVEG